MEEDIYCAVCSFSKWREKRRDVGSRVRKTDDTNDAAAALVVFFFFCLSREDDDFDDSASCNG